VCGGTCGQMLRTSKVNDLMRCDGMWSLTLLVHTLQVDAALACSYAALICHDDGKDISADSLSKILKAAKVDVSRLRCHMPMFTSLLLLFDEYPTCVRQLSLQGRQDCVKEAMRTCECLVRMGGGGGGNSAHGCLG
jgi:hypothetical protein